MKKEKIKNERMMNMTNLKGLFANNSHTNKEVTNRGNQLGNTANLTRLAEDVAKEILKIAETDPEKFADKIANSMQSHDAMDKLIEEAYDLSTVNIEFLKTESKEVIERMIKSQQSKRSRAKGKTMTLDNYLTMLTGAIAENLLRIAANKPKSSGGGARRTSVRYSEEELERFANDPEALKKAIRNIQSKKSIYKAKADFSEDSDRWKELLETEAQLKALRDGQSAEVERAIETTNQLSEMLATIDTNSLKAAEAKDMLSSIKEMLSAK